MNYYFFFNKNNNINNNNNTEIIIVSKQTLKVLIGLKIVQILKKCIQSIIIVVKIIMIIAIF